MGTNTELAVRRLRDRSRRVPARSRGAHDGEVVPGVQVVVGERHTNLEAQVLVVVGEALVRVALGDGGVDGVVALVAAFELVQVVASDALVVAGRAVARR